MQSFIKKFVILLGILGTILFGGSLIASAAPFLVSQGGTATTSFGGGVLFSDGGTNALRSISTSSLGFLLTSKVDPIASFNCAGITTTTTGSITSGTNSLSVASASGWSVGMGIAVANAGIGGTTELITKVTAINGTTFTLAANASATASGQTVNHDDTVCLQTAINSGSNPSLRLGGYNITSRLVFTSPQIFQCSGAVNQTTHSGGTTIWNRGTTNDSLDIESAYVTLDSCAILQASSTPTAGYGINIGSSTSPRIRMPILSNNLVYGTYGGITVTGNVIPAYIHDNFFWSLGGPTNTAGALYINNPSTAGDIKWIANEFRVIATGTVAYIVNADVEEFTNNKFNSCDTCLVIDNTLVANGVVVAQSFVNNSFEAGGNLNPLIQIAGSSTGISFIGGEIGTENGKGGLLLTGTSSNISIMGVDLHNISGTPITNNSTGSLFQVLGNTYSSGVQANNYTFGNRWGIGSTTPSTLSVIAIPDDFDQNGFQVTGHNRSRFIALNALNVGMNMGLVDSNGISTHFFRSYGDSFINKGNFGDGTSSPLARFDLWGQSGATSSILAVSTSTGASLFNINSNGNIGIATSTPTNLFTVNGDAYLTGRIYDSSHSSGSNGNVLQSTGSATTWVSTSSLNISASLSGGTTGLVTRWLTPTTIGTGKLIDDGTVTGVNATSSLYTFNIQGTSGTNPFNIASSTGTSVLTVANNGFLGLGTIAPTHALTIASSTPSTGLAIYNTADQTTNYERGLLDWSANTFRFETQKGGSGTARGLAFVTPNGTTFQERDTGGSNFFDFSRGEGTANSVLMKLSGTQVQSSGLWTGLSIAPTINQTSSAGYTGLLVQPTESGTGNGVKNLVQVGTSTNTNLYLVNSLGAEGHNNSFGNANDILTSNGASSTPTWNATSSLFGTLAGKSVAPIANGGTGTTTIQAVYDTLGYATSSGAAPNVGKNIPWVAFKTGVDLTVIASTTIFRAPAGMNVMVTSAQAIITSVTGPAADALTAVIIDDISGNNLTQGAASAATSPVVGMYYQMLPTIAQGPWGSAVPAGDQVMIKVSNAQTSTTNVATVYVSGFYY